MKLSSKITIALVASAHVFVIGSSLFETPEVKDAPLLVETNTTEPEPIIPPKPVLAKKSIIVPAIVKVVQEKKDLFEMINFKKFAEALKHSESSGRQFVINKHGYIGWYQIGMAQLEDHGYIKKGEYQRMRKSKLGQKTFIKNYVKWNNGLNLKKFLTHKQNEAFERICEKNYTSLKKYGFLAYIDDHKELQGVLFGAHLVGLTAAKRWLNGTLASASDANGMTIEKYYNKGMNI